MENVANEKSSDFLAKIRADMENEADQLEDLQRKLNPYPYNRKKRKIRVLSEKKREAINQI